MNNKYVYLRVNENDIRSRGSLRKFRNTIQTI